MSLPQPYGYPAFPVTGTVVVAPYRCSTAHVVIAWLLAVATGLYLLPWAIAATRNRRNVAAVALVDLFLGWTLIGWVVALVMACGSDRPLVLVQQTYAPPPVWSPPPPTWSQPPPAPGWAPAPPPAATPAAIEHTRIDPFGSEPTVWFPDRPGHGDRR